ncbi:RNA-directed DNA polymerase, eukaryota, Reverse transcriptase zinc-binding domain protein [Artemisia annua]|uniref:RNA-directed DNA polymerase, eukaryota, Reverse transcriptase zinc-binding domain protein n=1 Tax=Artemisia annua TaxID=35608 RepID=A0A2U1KRW8_ARTAN|nr:RNA-directed DNA polymerase, eukaryota, Reverse transcriptase zinc-binding domain protein [Artemisia annua]
MLLACSLRDCVDSWSWGMEGKEAYSVASCKQALAVNNSAPRNSNLKWEKWVPLKVNLNAWRADLDRLPTCEALARRRVFIQDTLCQMCRSANEDLKHILVDCIFAFGVWSGICKWCRLDPFVAYDFNDLLLLYKNVHGGKWKKKIVRGIVLIGIWAIWNARNEKIFQGKDMIVMKTVAEVKSKAFLWLKYRSKFDCIVWKDWAKYPLYLCL